MFRRIFLLAGMLLFSFCTPGKELVNSGVPYSKEWWETLFLRCALSQTPVCDSLLPPDLPPVFTPDAVSDTGVDVCTDTIGGNLACGGAIFPGQDADFVNVPSARMWLIPVAHPTFNMDYTTQDLVRGSIWKTCAEGQSGPTCGTGTSISADFATAPTLCSALNGVNGGQGYSGITTWRLPDILELSRMFNLRAPGGTEPFAFPGNESRIYHSSTPVWNIPGSRWYADMDVGFYDEINSINGNYSVRCVSGTPLSPPSFRDNGDTTVTDNRTGLIWVGGAGSGIDDWQNALVTCDNLALSGRSWRLPNANELLSIVDYTVGNPSINAAFFGGTVPQYYWTSTTSASNLSFAHAVFFNSGLMGGNDKSLNLNFRCVAGPEVF
ncbi:DUF1566 domain-containing protein [Leptospira ellisii]|uniref:DUF1566 domain-containing protein n=1 Tax=Leptospira ellisii TaxID=2023197 RepID=A0A2N0B900_9LEPT|nr:DUF1566 domain-containing protein [Leptospira ellisii]MDV6235758.1 DUF1566 domain-containing protein [Leptospira ellisii]PJZ93006.1 hypothetical protein CH379_10140 [Leptospira ellisii]